MFSIAILLLVSLVTSSAGDDRPNIVVFYADDLGIGDVGCFGNTTVRTPNIDSICERGVKLSQHLAAAPVCTPSRAALMTARYPLRTGLASPNEVIVAISLMSSVGLPPGEYTLPQMLKDKGYKTGLVGKWHLGLDCEFNDRCHNPTKFGFDFFFGAPFTNFRNLGKHGGDFVKAVVPTIDYILLTVTLVTIITGLYLKNKVGTKTAIIFIVPTLFLIGNITYGVKFPHIYNSVLQRNTDIVEMPINFERMTQRLVNEGVRFLEQRHEDGRPFFLMMSWLQVHTFLHAAHPFKGRSEHGPYGDEVEEMDWGVGEIMTALDELGLNQNTIIYFSSDNGGHKEEKDPRGRQAGGWNGIYTGGKGQGGQEGGIRMPSAIMWPGHFPAQSEVSEPTSQMDLMVTLASIVDGHIPTDRHIDGKNILPLLEGRETLSPHEFLFHYCGNSLHAVRYRPRQGSAVYKLHYHWPLWTQGADTCEGSLICLCFRGHQKLTTPKLFNVAQDPGEKRELDTSLPEYASVVERIEHGRAEHDATTTDSHYNQMGVLNQMGLIYKHPFCEFPTKLMCEDNDNALNYKRKYRKVGDN